LNARKSEIDSQALSMFDSEERATKARAHLVEMTNGIIIIIIIICLN
jgi:hypothetical protein